MPRIARGVTEGLIYHVLNRGNGRQNVFHKSGDYHAFVNLTEEAVNTYDVELFAYCVMPTHFHFLLRPVSGNDLSRFMQWLLTSHVRRYHQHYGTSGHVWQGRYKSFIVQDNEHLLTVARYVEGNPVRASLVKSARNWKWSSHRERLSSIGSKMLSELPIELPGDWASYTDNPLTSNEVERLRRSVKRQAPFGHDRWVESVCRTCGLESTIRERGRPRKE